MNRIINFNLWDTRYLGDCPDYEGYLLTAYVETVGVESTWNEYASIRLTDEEAEEFTDSDDEWFYYKSDNRWDELANLFLSRTIGEPFSK